MQIMKSNLVGEKFVNQFNILKNDGESGRYLKHLKMGIFPILVIIGMIFSNNLLAQRQMEYLTRGLVAVKSGDNIFLSWRKFATDTGDVSYNIFRDDSLINELPITGISNYVDTSGTLGSIYYVETLFDSTKKEISNPVTVWENNFITLPLQTPSGYSPNDGSVGDLDGDGELEIIVKMEGVTHDNAQSGVTDPVFLHAYEFDGTLLWSIDLGINIRGGAHYTQFMVYDLNGDGRAEVACKTAPGTKDGSGSYLNKGPAVDDDDGADYRTTGSWDGFIIEGPEYLTVFNGLTGNEITTVNYVPSRDPTNGWGKTSDNTNRVDRFLACVAYFDTIPSLVMCRGYYGRSVLVAWDFDGNELTQRWVFDSNPDFKEYEGQGAHSISVGDVDNDGYDEIMYGAMAIDHDGTPLYNTLFCHGDATHLGDFIPGIPGLEFYMPSESAGWSHSGVTNPQVHIRNAATGEVIRRIDGEGDIGRAMIGDITSDHEGCEFWSAGDVNVYNSDGTSISTSRPPINFASWWDGDLLREMLDGNAITKWGTDDPQLSASGCSSNNGTKSTPTLSGDIIGDWREEVIFRTTDNQSLRLYTTTETTQYGIYTLLQDPQYRLALVWQNVAYNQPPHPSFFIGHNMEDPPIPDIKITDPSDNPLIRITSPKKGYELGLGLNLDVLVAVLGIPDTNEIFISIDDEIVDTLTSKPFISEIPDLSTGSFTLVASAYDKKGILVESSPVDFTVDMGYPHITLTTPKENDTFLPEDSVTISVDAFDTDGVIDSVSFYLNNEWLAVLENAPYNLKIENPGVGIYDIKAIVYDDSLFSTESEVVEIGIGKVMTIQENNMGFCDLDGTVDNNHVGYSGTGFANTDNSSSVQITWAVNFPEEAEYIFIWRYASTSVRPGSLLFNDTLAVIVDFENTGAWTSWETTTTKANAREGIVKVTLKATRIEGLANIDYLKIISLGSESEASPISCASLPQPNAIDEITFVKEKYNIYPVPAQNFVNVSLPDKMEIINNVSIFRIDGSKIFTKSNIYKNETRIDLPETQNGFYLILINTNNDSFIGKFNVYR